MERIGFIYAPRDGTASMVKWMCPISNPQPPLVREQTRSVNYTVDGLATEFIDTITMDRSIYTTTARALSSP
ncbi:hypothetical protein ACE1BM_24130, partial [Aeromonas jandaei]